MYRQVVRFGAAILAFGACSFMPVAAGAQSSQKLYCSIEPTPLKLTSGSPAASHDLDCEGFLREGYYRIEFGIDSAPRRGNFTVRIFDVAGGRRALIEEIEAARFRRALKAPPCENGKRCLLSRRIFATSGTREDERIVPQFRIELAASSPARTPALTVARVFAYIDPPEPSEMRPAGVFTPAAWDYFASLSRDSPHFAQFKAVADATVLVMLQDGGRSCSGVLVAPKRVLTNYHCFRNYVDGSETIPGIVSQCPHEVTIEFFKHGEDEPSTASAKCARVLPFQNRNRNLDYAVIEIGPLVRPDGVPIDEPDPVRFSDEPLSATTLLNGVSHDGVWPLRLSLDCEAGPGPLTEAMKSQLAALGIPHNAASIRHRCNTTGGGSGSPLFDIDPGAQQARFRGLHHSGYVSEDVENSQVGIACFRAWFKGKFSAQGWNADYWNFAYDARAVRCALVKDGVLPAASGPQCRASDIPTMNNFNPSHSLRTEWRDHWSSGKCGRS